MSFNRNGALGSKRSDLAQKRVYSLIGIGLACTVLVVVSIAIPIALFQSLDRKAQEECWRLEISEADRLTSLLRGNVIDVIAAVRGFKGFVMGLVNSTPPFNGTVRERTENQSFEQFPKIASWVLHTTKYVSLFLLAPGGVVLQSYPANESVALYDFLAYNNELASVSVLDSIDTAKVDMLGPLRRGIPSLNVEWQLIVRDPIYTDVGVKGVGRENFWGFAASVVDVGEILESNALYTSARSKGLDYLIYTEDGLTKEIIPIFFSLMEEPSPTDLREFIETGTTRPVLRRRLSWHVCMRRNFTGPKLTKTVIVLIVTIAVFASLILCLIAFSLVLVCMREYDDRSHAPKMAPFAMIVIGVCGGEQVWELAPDHMLSVSKRLGEMQRLAISRHHAYEGVQLHPYTTTIITRTVDTALQLCFSLLEELQLQPIDRSLQRLLGDDGRLLVACTVHWCKDASVLMDGVNGRIRYEGPDVKYGGRLWMFAVPNKVLISSVTLEAVGKMPDTEIRPLGSVFIRGVAERQELFTITKPNNKWLRKASELAQDCMSSRILALPPNVSGGMNGNPLSAEIDRSTHGNYAHNSNDAPWGASSNSGVRVRSERGAMDDDAHGNSDRCGLSSSLQSGKRVRQINVPSATGLTAGDPMMSTLTPQDVSNRQSSSISTERNTSCERSDSGNRGGGEGFGESEALLGLMGTEERSLDGDLLTDVLLHPKIPVSVDTHLRTVFEQQTIILDISYDSLRTIVFFFFSAFKLLMKPLAMPERSNIFRRLVIAFGVPQQNILEHLAVRCALRYIQHIKDTRLPLWNYDQQRRMHMAALLLEGTSRANDSNSTYLVEDLYGASLTQSIT